jgi:hypothetical protein
MSGVFVRLRLDRTKESEEVSRKDAKHAKNGTNKLLAQHLGAGDCQEKGRQEHRETFASFAPLRETAYSAN